MFDKLKASRELLLWGAVGSAAFLTVMGLVRWIYEASGDTGSWRGASLSVGTLTLPPLPLLIGLLADPATSGDPASPAVAGLFYGGFQRNSEGSGGADFQRCIGGEYRRAE